MKGITKNELSKECWWPLGYSQKPHGIVLADLNHVRDSIVSEVDKEQKKIISLNPVLVKDTPHYQYALGNKAPYEEYLNKCKHITWARAGINEEHLEIQYMFDKFDAILNSDKLYLDPPFENKYIIVADNGLLIDGLHRAVALLSSGIDKAPIALVRN